jgi:hypothetical protein
MEWITIGLDPDKAERSKLLSALIQLGASPLALARLTLNERVKLVMELQAKRFPDFGKNHVSRTKPQRVSARYRRAYLEPKTDGPR